MPYQKNLHTGYTITVLHYWPPTTQNMFS